jgi:site-specific DNA recombinase
MKKVAILARVSTRDKQDYQRQISDMTRVIVSEGYSSDDIDVYAEKISGYSKREDRIQFKELMDKIEANPKLYDCIYTTEISRVGRNPTETRKLVDWLTDLGVPLYIGTIRIRTIEADGKRNFITSIILQVLMEVANNEAEQLKERSRSGLRQSASIGRAGGSNNHAYGYMKGEDKMLVINPDEVDTVKMIYRLYSQNKGCKAISNVLNEMKIPTRTNKTHGDKTINFKIPKDGSKVKWCDKTFLIS